MPDIIYSFQTFVERAKDGSYIFIGTIAEYITDKVTGGPKGEPGEQGEPGEDGLQGGRSFSVYHSGAAQVISAATWTKLEMNTTEFDRGQTGWSDDDELHRPEDENALGVWLFSASVATTPATEILIRLVAEDSEGTRTFLGRGRLGFAAVTGMFYLSLASSEVWVEAYALAGATIDGNQSLTYLVANLIEHLEDAEPETGDFDGQVDAGVDDAHELDNGTNFTATGTTLRVEPSVTDSSRWNAGMVFHDVTIPNAATITAAYVEVVFPASQRDSPRLDWFGNLVDDASDFAVEQDVTGRALTVASVPWVDDDLGSGVYIESPDLSEIVQEIVDRVGWSSGSSLCMLAFGQAVAGPEATRFTPYENEPTETCKLHVDYTVP